LSPTSISFASVLRKLLPKSEVTFVLDVDPAICNARKPELLVPELERQRGVLLTLATSDSRYNVINANRPAEEVANVARWSVINLLIKRRGVRR